MTTPPLQLDARLASLLDWLETTGRSAESFVYEQAPLIAREIVAWTLWSNLVYSLLGILALVCAGVLVRIGVRMWRTEKDQNVLGMKLTGLSFPAFVLVLVGAAACACHIAPTIKAVVAPRLVILDYVRGLR